ncbi:MAG TPA: hypothetical protein VK427_14845 [Kofleriaceae bacterium]|nr:hypothetical protein [Kofleriaceae bacterium]
MTRRLVAALLVAGLATTAAAQTVPLDVFLEQRVAEELAADGTILSRLGVALDVEVVGDKTIVSLVDPATRRAVASTKVDKLPEDRDASVATITQVAANLASQLASNNSTSAATTAAMKEMLEGERRHREQKELAEASYAREAIRFSDVAVVTGGKSYTTTSLVSIPYQGDRRLSPPEFFEAVERPDLRERYHTRRNGGIAAAIGGNVAMLGALYIIIDKGTNDSDFNSCSFTQPDYSSCRAAAAERERRADDDAEKWRNIGIGIGIGGAVVATVGYYYIFRANPVSLREAHDLADSHNAKLRAKHGLGALPRKRFENVALTPYADAGGGGLSLSGRF